MGLGAGTVNSCLQPGEGFVAESAETRIRAGNELVHKIAFGYGATLETPGGAADFGDERGFERSFRGQFGLEGIDEFLIAGFFTGTNVIALSEKAMADGVA